MRAKLTQTAKYYRDHIASGILPDVEPWLPAPQHGDDNFKTHRNDKENSGGESPTLYGGQEGRRNYP
ncbi:MAG: hypothetical protein ABIP71_04925 [Verrucomicrobiota bacterium]